ncbi:hypothetical protein AVEN_213226-1 [Araneus ventricosus]|uniref:Uncharacterized protein n=1 Tax=Araneus ventricosus TaxID=182803 RepID=A0A4Y2JR68_ARAVE|nr:hypothetical protein AVEN_213226-1 [Araneus ventricosus]
MGLNKVQRAAIPLMHELEADSGGNSFGSKRPTLLMHVFISNLNIKRSPRNPTKPVTHFIAQSLHVSAHQQSGQQTVHMHAAHSFLDIQIISNKLGVAAVAHRAISQYPPLDIGNSFCLVVKIRNSEPKGLRFYTAARGFTLG